MFYCKECADKKEWPFELPPKSYGKCEMCGKITTCADRACSLLPNPPSESKDKE